MKKSKLMIAALVGAFAANFYCNRAHAQLLDQAISSTIGAATEVGAATHQPLDSDTINQRLQQQGYSNINASPNNPGQFTATTPNGMNMLLTVEPLTGKVIGAAPQ